MSLLKNQGGQHARASHYQTTAEANSVMASYSSDDDNYKRFEEYHDSEAQRDNSKWQIVKSNPAR